VTARDLPFLGPEAITSHTGLCGFVTGAPGVQPKPPSCLGEATWHGLVLTEDGSACIAQLSCCDEHKAAMALTAAYVHEYGTACAIYGSKMWWNSADGTSGCFIDWDTTALASAEAVPVTA
jgi:hypothetical protein